MSEDPVQWGPDLGAPEVRAALVEHGGDLDALLAAVAGLRRVLGVPVQALRADRVASWVHVVMAADHARRAVRDGRARAEDPAVEFLLYAALDRQIHRAVAALGVPRGVASPVVVVALGRVQEAAWERAVRGAFGTWRSWDGAAGPTGQDAAAWWAARLGVAPERLEDRLLAGMALLVFDKA